MSRLAGAVILAFVLCCSGIGTAPVLRGDFDTYVQYLLDYNKSYSDAELLYRFKIFLKNIEEINRMNGNGSNSTEPADDDEDNSTEDNDDDDSSEESPDAECRYGEGPFTDWSNEEFWEKIANLNMTSYANLLGKMEEWQAPKKKAPANFDWRKKNKVTPIKNQGSCGSCWAFSVAANCENLYMIKNNKQMTFSEQQLLDCDRASSGCQGGWPEKAIKSVMDYGGFDDDKSYPYQGQQGSCRFSKSAVKAKISKNVQLPNNNENAYAQYLASTSSFITLINANNGFQHYKSGIFNPSSSECANSQNALNHALITVAYGKQGKKGLPFWVLKNSWGTGWGEKGFMRISRGKNTCGIGNIAHSAKLA